MMQSDATALAARAQQAMAQASAEAAHLAHREQAYDYFRHRVEGVCHEVCRSFREPPDLVDVVGRRDNLRDESALEFIFSNGHHQLVELDRHLLEVFSPQDLHDTPEFCRLTYARVADQPEYRARRGMAVAGPPPTRDFDMRPGAVNWVAYDELANFTPAQAEAKAEVLLREWLSPAQLAQFDKDQSFEVIGCDSGKTYLIRSEHSYNIDELGKSGGAVETYCVVPEGAPALGDIMLAQKIALEHHEKKTLKIANRRGLYAPGPWATISARAGRWLTGDVTA